MSTDYEVTCPKCEVCHHAGQRMAGKFSLGFGTGDTIGVVSLEKFIDEHIDCNGGTIQILNCDRAPTQYKDVTVYSCMKHDVSQPEEML